MKKNFDTSILKDLSKTVMDSFGDKIRMIDIDDIEPNADNFYDVSDVALLAEDIERQGLKHNLVVVQTENGKYKLISGHRRYSACRMLFEENRLTSHYLPCYVNSNKSNDENMQDLIMLNATSRIISDSELIKQFEELKRIFDSQKASGVKTGRVREKISEILGVSNGQVAKLENISKNAVPELKKAVEKGEISVSTANEIANLNTEVQENLLETSKPGDIKHKDVKEFSSRSKPNEKKDDNEKLSFMTTFDGDEDVEYIEDDEEDSEEPSSENAEYSEFVKTLSNDEKRRAFTKNYKDWGLWFEIKELFELFYKYDLPDETRIIVMEHKAENHSYNCYPYNKDEPQYVIRTRIYIQRDLNYFHPECVSDHELSEHLKGIKEKYS